MNDFNSILFLGNFGDSILSTLSFVGLTPCEIVCPKTPVHPGRIGTWTASLIDHTVAGIKTLGADSLVFASCLPCYNGWQCDAIRMTNEGSSPTCFSIA